jgi:aminoglycoside 2''-phosphotransferase
MLEFSKRVKKDFPEFSFKKVKDLSRGLDHKVLLFDDLYLFRFPKEEYYKKFILTEMKLLDALKKHKVPYYEWRGKDYGAYRVLKGKPLSYIRYKKIKDKDKLHKELASFLSELHSLKLLKGLNTRRLPYFFEEYEERMKFISSYFDTEELRVIEKALNKLKTTPFPTYCVAHSDLHFDHILVDEELRGIIDFSDAEITDPAIDFHLFWNFGEKVVRDIYDKYKGPKDGGFLQRSQLYNLVDMLSTLYDSEKHNKPSWKKPALRRIHKIISEELKLE